MGFFHGVITIIKKDLSMELRAKEVFTTTFMFALLTVVIFNFAVEMNASNTKQMAAGVLWVAFLFSGAISMNRSFLYEKEEGCLSALMLAPIDRSSIFFGKMATSLIVTLLTMTIIVPVFTVLFNVNVMERFFWQALTFFFGGLGFVTVGSLISAVSVNLRAREMMGPLLMLPVVVPVVISAVKLSGGLINGEEIGTLMIWVKTLAVFDVVYLVIAWLVFESIIEE